jgi:preprotein translocase subunit SecY
MKWQEKLVLIFKIKELRRKILFVVLIFFIFRLLSNIPVFSVNVEKLKETFERFRALGLYSIFTGGSLDHISIVMLGLGPYITAIIILQLLTMLIPSLEEMYKEGGEEGRQKFNQYGRILSIPLAMLQAFGMLRLFQREGIISSLSPLTLFSSVLTIAAGSCLLMWLGELITEYGIGDGISILIFAGIVSRTPINALEAIKNISLGKVNFYSYLFFLFFSLLIIAGVVSITEAKREIPISYTKRVRGFKIYGGSSTYLPMSINPAGVMPIIFALSILTFPSMIFNLLGTKAGILGFFAKSIEDFFKNPWAYGTSYFLLVCIFTYFYTAITFDPKTIAENLQKMGAFVPGIRPGDSTSGYLKFVLNRILLIGAIFLGLIAISPEIITILTKITQFSFLIGGTSLLIIVGVILDLIKNIDAELEMREYEKI